MSDKTPAERTAELVAQLLASAKFWIDMAVVGWLLAILGWVCFFWSYSQ